MFKGGATTADGKTLVLFGLSNENLRRLPNDEPIKVNLAEWGYPKVDVVLFAGETEETMARDLQELIGPDTSVSTDGRLMGGHD